MYPCWPTYRPCSFEQAPYGMKIGTYPCPKCGEEEETAHYFLCKSNAMVMARYSVFGAYLMETSELQKVQPYTLLRLLEPQRDLYNLPVILGLRIWPKLTTASALDGFGCPPQR